MQPHTLLFGISIRPQQSTSPQLPQGSCVATACRISTGMESDTTPPPTTRNGYQRSSCRDISQSIRWSSLTSITCELQGSNSPPSNRSRTSSPPPHHHHHLHHLLLLLRLSPSHRHPRMCADTTVRSRPTLSTHRTRSCCCAASSCLCCCAYPRPPPSSRPCPWQSRDPCSRPAQHLQACPPATLRSRAKRHRCFCSISCSTPTPNGWPTPGG